MGSQGVGRDWALTYTHIDALHCCVQFSCSVVSDYLQPHVLQHARPPCPSPTPGVHPNPRLSSGWCHPAISSSVVPFSSCPQSLSASEYIQVISINHWFLWIVSMNDHEWPVVNIVLFVITLFEFKLQLQHPTVLPWESYLLCLFQFPYLYNGL